MLVGLDGQPLSAATLAPTRSEAIEARVNAELQSLDSLLFIKWIPTAYFNQRYKRFEGRYALCCKWPQADKRMEWVQQGKHDPAEAFDALGWFCENIHDGSSVPVNPEHMLDKAKELLSKCDNSRTPWRDRLVKAFAKNVDARQKAKKLALDMAHEEAIDAYYHSSRAMRAFGGLPKEASSE